MRKGFTRYVKIWVGIIALTLLSVTTLNLVVDPFGVHQVVRNASWAPYKSHGRGRTGKAEMVRQGPWDTVLLGSSRAENGIDPAHPAWCSKRVLNVALGGPNLYEVGYVFRYVVEHGDVKRIVLFIDLLMFDERGTFAMDFTQSRFDPETNILEYRLGHLLGYRAVDASYQTILRARRDIAPVRTELGFRVWERRRSAVARGYRYQFDRVILEYLSRDSINSYIGYNHSLSRLALFEEIVATCREKDIALIVIIPPVHALQLETMRIGGVWNTFETWKRDLVAVLRRDHEKRPQAGAIPLWDFTGYSTMLIDPVPAEGDAQTTMSWFWECSHFKKELGDLVIHRVLDDDAAGKDAQSDFGVLLTLENLDDHLKKIRDDREWYAREHPEEIARVERLAHQAASQ
jgi:hypothetical protein